MKKKSVFFKRGFNILINVFFTTILLLVCFVFYKLILIIVCKIPNLNNYIGNLISVSVTIILAIISYFTKIKNYFKLLLYKSKQKVYILLSIRYDFIISKIIENYNINKLFGTTEQIEIINSAINILKNNKQNIILISSNPGKGKTTTLMLMLDVIAHDKELYKLFIELQNNIVYFDSAKDYEQLIYFLNRPENQTNKIVIIDNIQKYTIVTLNEIIKRLKIMVSFAQQETKKVLFILLYQETERNETTYIQIKNSLFHEDQNIFTLNQNFNDYSHKRKGNLKNEIFSENIDDIRNPFLKYHFERIFYKCEDISFIKFINQLFFSKQNSNTNYTLKEKKEIYVLASIIFICYYYGYITKNVIAVIWKKEYKFLFELRLILNYYVHNQILTPFPFIHNAYIFNEQLAREYKKILVENTYFLTIIYSIAEYMFSNCDVLEMKWLYFVSCSPEFCIQYAQEERIHLFERALNSFHLQYILDIVENETFIIPKKADIFRQELGIIYIYNGEWKKAKKILYPYIHEHNINKDIWQIQLKIIEAEHGCNDENNLEMLDCMENECTDSITLFQIKYWREHILMEHGKFSLNVWKDLITKLKNSKKLSPLRNDEHFSIRIVSDYERTYFLKGNICYSDYKFIFDQYLVFNSPNTDSIEQLLSRAYYIQYDILFQLGIWGYIEHSDIAPNIFNDFKEIENENIIENLIVQAVKLYDICINKYQSAGKKKYRTLQVRRAELTLCIDSNQYISVLNKYNEFESYAKQNNIMVFEGYSNTQKGKAFALYAISKFSKGEFEKSKEFLDKSLIYLKKAKEVYEDYGNNYGAFRVAFLIILVNMIQERDNVDSIRFKDKFRQKIFNLQSIYNSTHNYPRENSIIQYMQENLCKISLPINIIRYYPIILQ